MSSAGQIDTSNATAARWGDMSRKTRIDAIKVAIADCISAGTLAKQVGTTRNAVLGLAFRNQLRFAREMHHQTLAGKLRQRAIRRELAGRTQTAPVRPALAIHDLPAPETWAAHREPIALLDLTDDTCRWPVGEAEGAKQMFCGDTVARKGYCACHAKMRGR